MEFSVFFRKIKAVLAMVNVFGKKVVSSVLAVLILLSVFLTLPMTAENVNAAVSAPTNLKVTEYSDKAAKLSWSKVAGVTGYLVYYSKDNSNFTKLQHLIQLVDLQQEKLIISLLSLILILTEKLQKVKEHLLLKLLQQAVHQFQHHQILKLLNIQTVQLS